MPDLIDDPAPGQNAPEFTVTEISGAVKKMVEDQFGRVRVRGEVGRVSRPRSGHVYLDLKDDRAVLAGVMWKGVAARLRTQPEEGMEVVATGKLTTFPGQSKYQMVIDDIAPAGVGALMAMLEKRRAALAAEGLFDDARKQAIPFLPRVIGVVTSPSGAVIRDILHRLRDRFPTRVLIWPAAVQGDRCAADVAAGIRGFNAMSPGGGLPRPDLIIVARGGGSLEDLWGFNEEVVVRAAADSRIPLISAVGHETDTTLIDHAADWRAPTPSAAAERAVPVRLDLLGTVDALGGRLGHAAGQGIALRRQRLRDLSRALPQPAELVDLAGQRLDMVAGRLPGALRAATQAKRVALGQAGAGLRPRLLTGRVDQMRRDLDRLSVRLAPALTRDVQVKSRDLSRLSSRLRADLLAMHQDRADQAVTGLLGRLDRAGRGQIATLRQRLDAVERMRQTLGYTETLRRGYAVIRQGDAVITQAKGQPPGTALEVEFQDGRLPVLVAGTPPAPRRMPKPRIDSPDKGGQGSLF